MIRYIVINHTLETQLACAFIQSNQLIALMQTSDQITKNNEKSRIGRLKICPATVICSMLIHHIHNANIHASI
jgi:hypothetical protein